MPKRKFSLIRPLARWADGAISVVILLTLAAWILTQFSEWGKPYRGKVQLLLIAVVPIAGILLGWRARRRALGVICLIASLLMLALLFLPASVDLRELGLYMPREALLAVPTMVILICLVFGAKKRPTGGE